MSCPICDNKPANCDCSGDAIRLHEENESLKLQVEAFRAALEKVCWDRWDTEAGKRGSCRVCGAMDNLSHYPDSPCVVLNPVVKA
jgi:hypothetical protein